MVFPSVKLRSNDEAPFWEEVREGYLFLRGQRRLFAIILLTYGVALVGTPYSRFLPVFATDVLHAGPSTFGLLWPRRGIGAVIAGLGIASFSRLRRRTHFVAMSVYSFSLWLILFSFCRSLPLSMLFLVLVGASNIAFRSVANSVVQMETPPHLLGPACSACFSWTKACGPSAHCLSAASPTWSAPRKQSRFRAWAALWRHPCCSTSNVRRAKGNPSKA